MNLIEWLREVLREHEVEPLGIYRRRGTTTFPLTAADADKLTAALESGEHLTPLPKEPAALANVIEVSLADFIMKKVEDVAGATSRRGSERGYPDVEIEGGAFGGGVHAVDIKVARRARSGRSTQSPISLYTGNTYFKHPEHQFPGMLRPFDEYASHVDVLAIYTFSAHKRNHIEDFEIIVQEPWRIASKSRSSSTREYIGAVKTLEGLRNGGDVFNSPEEFYSYWRKFKFKPSTMVQAFFAKKLKEQADRFGTTGKKRKKKAS